MFRNNTIFMELDSVPGMVGFAGVQFKEQPNKYFWYMNINQFYENGKVWDWTQNNTSVPATPARVRIRCEEEEENHD